MKSHRDASIWKTVSGLVFFLLLAPSRLRGVAGKFCSEFQNLGQQSQHRVLEGKNTELGRLRLVPISEKGKVWGARLAWGFVQSAQGSQA